MVQEQRRLLDLVSVGPKTLEDFTLLGVTSVAHLAQCDADTLYARLCDARGQRVDPCCWDVFATAIAQAKDPDLPEASKPWWVWTKVRHKQRRSGAMTNN